MKQSLSNTTFMCQHGTDSPAFFMVLEIKDQITPTGSTLFSFIICCSGRSERQRIFVRSHLTPHWLSNPGGTSCGTSDPSQAVSRARRSSLTFRYTPFCSTTSCLAQRALGLGLLGVTAFLAIYKYHHGKRRRGRRDVSEDLCSFLLLKPDEIFTNQYCYDR